MASDYVVDAHALVWFLEGNSRLGATAESALKDKGSVLHLPVIALAEACWVVEKKRTTIPDVSTLLQEVDSDPRFIVIPMDRRILDATLKLTAINEMHDRIIVATLLTLQSTGMSVSLLTCDKNIQAPGLVQSYGKRNPNHEKPATVRPGQCHRRYLP